MAAIKMGAICGAAGAVAGAAAYAFKSPNVQAEDRIMVRRRTLTAAERMKMKDVSVIYDKMRMLPGVASNSDVSIGIRCLYENSRIEAISIYDMMVACNKIIDAYDQIHERKLPIHMVRDHASRMNVRNMMYLMRKKADEHLAECLAQSGWQTSASTGLPFDRNIKERIEMMTNALDEMTAAAGSMLQDYADDGAAAAAADDAAAAADADAAAEPPLFDADLETTTT
jgi:hypothetical protein